MRRTTRKALVLTLAVGASIGMAEAPDYNGELGESSDAKFAITLRQQPLARIWGLEGLDLTPDEENVPAKSAFSACVYANYTDTGEYLLTVESPNAFGLVDGDKDPVYYTLAFNDQNDTSSEVSITGSGGGPTFVSGDLFAGLFTNQPDPVLDCSESNGTNLDVAITLGDNFNYYDLEEGDYSDTVTLTVAAN